MRKKMGNGEKKRKKRSRKIGFEDKLSITDHLEELRWRLIIICVAIGSGFLICYIFKDPLLRLIQRPLPEKYQELTFIEPAEALVVSLKVSFFAGLIISLPVVIYQIWNFVAPGLVKKERRYTLPFVISATILFLIGVVFAYFVILPVGIKFLMLFGAKYWKPSITVGNYLSFSLKLMLASGIIFELPLIVTFLSILGIVTPKQLSKNRKYVILLCFIIGAIFTPGPDPFSQTLMAIPLILLFEISIISAKIFGKKKDRKEGEEDV
ncbi:MAG: twin-arginine translocase subunit TatC [Nitrospinae bacterium]|nr:twin-arginine translocase subunit TatC [Nitrospinota bacterium]